MGVAQELAWWCMAKAVKDVTAKTVAEYIYEEIVVNYGARY